MSVFDDIGGGLESLAKNVGDAVSTAANDTAKGVEAVASSVVANPLADVEVIAGVALIAAGTIASPFTAGATISVSAEGAALIGKGAATIATGAMTKYAAQSAAPSPGSVGLAAQRAASPNTHPLMLGTSNAITSTSSTQPAANAATQTLLTRGENEARKLLSEIEGEVKSVIARIEAAL